MSAMVETLLSRQSVKFVQSPGPTGAQLDLILQAAMRAPDHGAVRPWRFALAQGADVPALVDVAVRVGLAEGKPLPEHKVANARMWLSKVPLVILLACRPDPNGRIRPEESRLSVATAVMNMLNAAHALGLHGFWSTGLGTYLDGMGEALGFDPLDEQFMGYLAIGTPIDAPRAPQRPDYRDFVREWHRDPAEA
ncbi:nitroreductase [uncultured Castellaniella sp.]|uniref:nitroreductase family protein n=1 Tax=uncultured Castellaniella sp. TaxID=647907 RepID=UPI002618706F|nr:nitroreductase [uncultured Castellaniella sp.]